MVKRYRFLFSGTVQGVGFRPYVYGRAVQYALSGFVRNRPDGVLVEVEGQQDAIDLFIEHVRRDLPPLADIVDIDKEEIAPSGEAGFEILVSDTDGVNALHLPPDTAVCPACLKEFSDPADRRYRYPFINCTHCGPRLTIIRDIPYDRQYTSMACFPMCSQCDAEYKNPTDRRFHAEPNACPVCGPSLTLLDSDGLKIESLDPVSMTIDFIKAGKILAVKGLGGFHLCVDATSETAVQALRTRKYREEKPLALMVRDLDEARAIAEIGFKEERLLLSSQRPIVLVKKKAGAAIAHGVAPGVGQFGIMLPYTPLHHLLLQGPPFLVMTSANQVDEPICIGNREAVERLKGIADYFLIHNRDILVRCDDSIAFVAAGRQRLIRRSRGFAPMPIPLHRSYPEVLALGPHLKGTLCLLKGRHAFLTPHIGDMETPQARDFFHESLALIKRITESAPRRIACDLHPGYYTTQLASELSQDVVGVQHHHAHIVSCMAENGLSGDVIGLSMDGTGYGPDGNAWGGEFMIAAEMSYRRVGHLRYMALPGGERAILEPWRIAAGLLRDALGDAWPSMALDLNLVANSTIVDTLNKMFASKTNMPLSSGLGRLFDGMGALLGLCRHVTFEGQAAMALEAAADWQETEPLPFELSREDDGFLVDFREAVRYTAKSVAAGEGREHELASRFHGTLHKAFGEASRWIREECGLNRVVLSGGCFQNRILLEGTVSELQRAGFEVYAHRLVPTNDGGISLGQAVVAASTLCVA